MEPKDFTCTKCGAPLDYDGSDARTVRCPYCNTSVIVPPELRRIKRQDAPPAQPSRAPILLVGALVVVAALGLVWLALPKSPSASNGDIANAPAVVVPATAVPTQARPTAVPTSSVANKTLTFGSAGTGPGMFTDATNIATDGDGHIYVGDRKGGRVQVFDSTGKFVTQWMVGDSKSIISSLAADRQGHVYVTRDGSIERHDATSGKLLDTLQYAGGNRFESTTLAADGGLAAMWYQEHPGVLDSREGVQGDLVQFDALGRVTRVISSVVSAQTDGPERYVRLAMDGLGNIYAASTYSSAIFKFSREGKFILRFGGPATSPKPDQFNIGTVVVGVDNQGRVLAANGQRVLVFSSDGGYLATFAVDGPVYSMAIDDKNGVWLAESDHVSKFEMNLQ